MEPKLSPNYSLMLHRTGRVLLCATLVFLTGCHRATDGTNRDGSPISTLRIGYFGAVGNGIGVLGWANKRGILIPGLKAARVTDVKFIRFTSGTDVNEALASGSLDFCSYGDSPAIQGRAEDVPDRVLAISSGASNMWLVSGPNGPSSVDGLSGKIVASMGGGTSFRYITQILAEHHLRDKVKIVKLEQTLAEPALLRGDLAAAVTNGPLLLDDKLHVIDEAATHKHLLPVGVDVVSQSYLDAHPNFASAWVKTRASAIADLRSHLDDYYAFSAAAWKEPAWMQKKYFPVQGDDSEPFTEAKIKALEDSKAFLLSQKMIPKDFSVRDWIYPAAASKPGDSSAPATNP